MSALRDALRELGDKIGVPLPLAGTCFVPDAPSCPAIRQGDEVYCPVAGCGLRWSLDEDRPECPK